MLVSELRKLIEPLRDTDTVFLNCIFGPNPSPLRSLQKSDKQDVYVLQDHITTRITPTVQLIDGVYEIPWK